MNQCSSMEQNSKSPNEDYILEDALKRQTNVFAQLSPQKTQFFQPFQVIEDFFQKISNQINEIDKTLHNGFYQFNNIFSIENPIFAELLQRLEKAFNNIQAYPDDLKKIQGHLKSQGWFLSDDNIIRIRFLATLLEAKKIEEIELYMEETTREHCDGIFFVLINIFPERADILKDAFEAHKKGLFTLSVPVLLTQVDGICTEIFGQALFINKHQDKREKKINEYLADEEGWFRLGSSLTRLFLQPIVEPGRITNNTKLRQCDDKQRMNEYPLNRNGVLHGLHCDYATERKSLKIISQLDYLNKVVFIFKKQILKE